MMVVKFCSGIGNQMYQYAVYLLLKKSYPDVLVKADLTAFEDDEILNDGNGFPYGFAIASLFGINIDVATEREVRDMSFGMVFDRRFCRIFPGFVKKYTGVSRLASLRGRLIPKYGKLRDNHIRSIPFDAYNGNILHLDPLEDYYLDGLWQNISYPAQVEKELRETIALNVDTGAAEWADAIGRDAGKSVAVHVRRGNFASEKYTYTHNLCGTEYYSQAFRIIEESIKKPVYYVFSDDIAWCRENLPEGRDMAFVSGDCRLTTKDEMALMGMCGSAVIPNSTFAFWSIWLGREKRIVVCPKYSVREKTCWHEFSVPGQWVKIDNLR